MEGLTQTSHKVRSIYCAQPYWYISGGRATLYCTMWLNPNPTVLEGHPLITANLPTLPALPDTTTLIIFPNKILRNTLQLERIDERGLSKKPDRSYKPIIPTMSFVTAADVAILVNSENTASERRISPAWTISHFKGRLEPITGIPSSSQRLTLRQPGHPKPGIPIEAADEETTRLENWHLTPYAEIYVGVFVALLCFRFA